MTVLDRALLRAEVGVDNFSMLQSVCALLDALAEAEALSREGADRVTVLLAQELAEQTTARQVSAQSPEGP